jgi:hypothetical protein
MRVLIGFERFGVLREAFRKRGHDAWSCDLAPAEDKSQFHFCCDIFDIVNQEWDLAILHPDCTFLTVSAAWAFTDGPYHQRVKLGTLVGASRRVAREKALQQVGDLMALNIERIAIENPAASFISSRYRKADQIIHPNQFGDDASKATGLWLKNLPALAPTKQIEPRIIAGKPRWANQTDSGQNRLSPSPDRAMLRSKTYSGIADAMGEQWGSL